MKARIYKQAKNAMQSGQAKTGTWVLEYGLDTPRRPEPLMGWTSSGDTNNQVSLHFETEAQAAEFAEKQGLSYTVQAPHAKRIEPRNYGDNFRYFPPKSDTPLKVVDKRRQNSEKSH